MTELTNMGDKTTQMKKIKEEVKDNKGKNDEAKKKKMKLKVREERRNKT